MRLKFKFGFNNDLLVLVHHETLLDFIDQHILKGLSDIQKKHSTHLLYMPSHANHKFYHGVWLLRLDCFFVCLFFHIMFFCDVQAQGQKYKDAPWPNLFFGNKKKLCWIQPLLSGKEPFSIVFIRVIVAGPRLFSKQFWCIPQNPGHTIAPIDLMIRCKIKKKKCFTSRDFFVFTHIYFLFGKMYLAQKTSVWCFHNSTIHSLLKTHIQEYFKNIFAKWNIYCNISLLWIGKWIFPWLKYQEIDWWPIYTQNNWNLFAIRKLFAKECHVPRKFVKFTPPWIDFRGLDLQCRNKFSWF